MHLCVHESMCVCHCFVLMPFLVHVNPHLFSKRQSAPQTASSASPTRMMCHHRLCRCIPVRVLTLSNYHTNSRMRRLYIVIYYYCITIFVV